MVALRFKFIKWVNSFLILCTPFVLDTLLLLGFPLVHKELIALIAEFWSFKMIPTSGDVDPRMILFLDSDQFPLFQVLGVCDFLKIFG